MDALGPVCWGVGPPWIRPAPACPTVALSGIWGIWRPGQHLGPFTVFLRLFLSRCLWCVREHCPAGGPLPSSSVVVMSGCTWSTTVFGWVICVKWHPHECQHPRFPSRTSHCDEMINVIHATCQFGALGKILAGAPLHRSQFHSQLSYTHTETACMYSRFYFF